MGANRGRQVDEGVQLELARARHGEQTRDRELAFRAAIAEHDLAAPGTIINFACGAGGVLPRSSFRLLAHGSGRPAPAWRAGTAGGVQRGVARTDGLIPFDVVPLLRRLGHLPKTLRAPHQVRQFLAGRTGIDSGSDFLGSLASAPFKVGGPLESLDLRYPSHCARCQGFGFISQSRPLEPLVALVDRDVLLACGEAPKLGHLAIGGAVLRRHLPRRTLLRKRSVVRRLARQHDRIRFRRDLHNL